MDREQAAEIHRHLLTAARAISRVGNLTFDLSEEDERRLQSRWEM
jgi:hypothetical protein